MIVRFAPPWSWDFDALPAVVAARAAIAKAEGRANAARHTLQRLDSFVDATKGKRITYKEVIA